MNNVKELRKKEGLSQAELAKKMSVHQTLISQIERGVVIPSGATLVQLAEFFRVSTDYILGREDGSIESILGKPSPGAVRIPVLGRVAAGLPLYTAEEIIDWEEIPEAMAADGEHFGLKVTGHSMEPRICDGDVVIVRRQDTCDNGNIAIVLINGDEATCKRVKVSDHGISLISTNPEYEPLFYTKHEVEALPVRILGVVVELRGKFNY